MLIPGYREVLFKEEVKFNTALDDLVPENPNQYPVWAPGIRNEGIDKPLVSPIDPIIKPNIIRLPKEYVELFNNLGCDLKRPTTALAGGQSLSHINEISMPSINQLSQTTRASGVSYTHGEAQPEQSTKYVFIMIL